MWIWPSLVAKPVQPLTGSAAITVMVRLRFYLQCWILKLCILTAPNNMMIQQSNILTESCVCYVTVQVFLSLSLTSEQQLAFVCDTENVSNVCEGTQLHDDLSKINLSLPRVSHRCRMIPPVCRLFRAQVQGEAVCEQTQERWRRWEEGGSKEAEDRHDIRSVWEQRLRKSSQ